MKILALVSLLLSVVGLAAAWWKNRSLPESVSATVYQLPMKGRSIWSIWIAAVIITGGIPLIDAMGAVLGVFGFAAVLCLMIVGTLPLGRCQANTGHYIFGSAGGVLTQICVSLISPLWLMVWLPFDLLK